MNSQSQIVDKIRKLLALSKSSNIHEAANAASVANKYIVQYRLKEADFINQNESDNYDSIYDDPAPVYESARVTIWKAHLLCLLANHYGCAVWNDKHRSQTTIGRSVSRYRLVGRFNDVKFTRYMFVWTCSEIKRHSDYECKNKGYTEAASYCQGAVRGVEDLLLSTRATENAVAIKCGKSKAIALINNRGAEAKSYLFNKYNLSEPVPNKPKFSPNAFDRGFSIGSYIGANIAPSNEK